MKTIGILCDKSVKFNKSKPFTDKFYNQDYAHLARIGRQYNINFILAPYTEYSDKSFKRAWIYDHQWKKAKNQKIEAVFDKVDALQTSLKKKIDQDMPMMNHYEFQLLCTDKWLTYKKWPHLFAKTVLASNISAARKMKTDLLVLKPRTGNSGQGIKFISRNKIIKYPTSHIIQEFIPGGKVYNYSGQHDFRMLVIDGKIIVHTIRIPHKHKYLCNWGQGGKEHICLDKKIPPVFKRIFLRVEKDLKKIRPRIYSIDCMVDKNGIAHLIELNARPAITHYFNKKAHELLHHALCKSLKKYV